MFLNGFIYVLLSGLVACEPFWQTPAEKLWIQAHGMFHWALNMEKELPINLDVSFNLYTRHNPQIEQILPVDYPELLHLSHFNFSHKTVFIIHGYTDNKNRAIVVNLRRALIQVENETNVIVVDWSRLAALIYWSVIKHTTRVGEYIGDFLNTLDILGYNLTRVHLIGHSLGAHIAGIAASWVDSKVGRITGLDPAAPLFEIIEHRGESVALDKTDAMFIDVIHTNIHEFGHSQALGHADFYPNGGTSPQPGCLNPILLVSCSHNIVYDFYTESILLKNRPFEARHCNVTKNNLECLNEIPVHMGYYVNESARGVYFLTTKDQSPYAKHWKK